jgi:hypothetical protein
MVGEVNTSLSSISGKIRFPEPSMTGKIISFPY